MNMHSNELSQPLIEKIKSAIKKQLSMAIEPNLTFKIIYDDDRQIYRIDINDENDFFILKVRGNKAVKELDLSESDLEKEYNLLRSAWDSVKQMPNNFSMSEPIALWPEFSAILMSGCEGANLNTTFNKNIFKWTFNPTQLKTLIFNCGYWLGCYHKLSSSHQSLNESLLNRENNFLRMLTFLDTSQKNPLNKNELHDLRHIFKNLITTHEKGFTCQVHGNYAFRNILCNTTQTNLVDFEDAHVEHVAFDIGQFLAEILFKSQFPWIRHHTKNLLSAFNEGYEKTFSYEKPIVNAYVIYHLVVHLYEHCGRKQSSKPGNLLLRYRIYYLGKLIKKLI